MRGAGISRSKWHVWGEWSVLEPQTNMNLCFQSMCSFVPKHVGGCFVCIRIFYSGAFDFYLLPDIFLSSPFSLSSSTRKPKFVRRFTELP